MDLRFACGKMPGDLNECMSARADCVLLPIQLPASSPATESSCLCDASQFLLSLSSLKLVFLV